MKTLLVVGVLSLIGCAPVLDAQCDLITQARRGVALVATAQDQHAQTARQLAQIRRERLDEAFDADVRDQVELTADWVIEARAALSAPPAIPANTRDVDDVREQARKIVEPWRRRPETHLDWWDEMIDAIAAALSRAATPPADEVGGALRAADEEER